MNRRSHPAYGVPLKPRRPPVASDLSMTTVQRVKSGEVWDTTRRLNVFIAERWPPWGQIWLRASVMENNQSFTCSWHCQAEEEAVKWFNVYVELYGPPRRGEFLGFKYDNAKVSETNVVPPMSCGS